MRYRPLLLALLCVLAPGAASAKLYKWVDANGKVHYSDKVPPEAVTQEREVKSETGLTVDKVAAPPTREQLEAERRARAEAEARARAEAEQAEKDRILLLTWASADEIERARDERVAAIDSRIRFAQERIGKLDEQIESERKRAAQMERSGKGSPDDAYRRIEELQRQIREQEAFIRSSQEERAETEARFNSDLERFRKIQAGRK